MRYDFGGNDRAFRVFLQKLICLAFTLSHGRSVSYFPNIRLKVSRFLDTAAIYVDIYYVLLISYGASSSHPVIVKTITQILLVEYFPCNY